LSTSVHRGLSASVIRYFVSSNFKVVDDDQEPLQADSLPGFVSSDPVMSFREPVEEGVFQRAGLVRWDPVKSPLIDVR
jgi:hypothetical protein